MKFLPTRIPDVVLIEPTVYKDERGWFMESFNQEHFNRGLRDLGLPSPISFVQDNHSSSKKGVLRGLHFQRDSMAQGKLVRVTQGAAFDVAVDIRPESPRYAQWVGVELSASNRHMLWIPPGFAHGFLALEEETQVLYKTTAPYSKLHERAIRWDDPSIGIEWPLSSALLLSEKDLEAGSLLNPQ
jgi:dTDP-4-dehydrorhamnose 3,5-epimerase